MSNTDTTTTTTPQPSPSPTPSPTPAPAATPSPTPSPAQRDATGKFNAPTPAGYWPADWRETVAKVYGGTDVKRVDQELKRLQRFTDPAAAWGLGRQLESTISEGSLVKRPGAKASDEERATWRRTMDIPEKPEGYREHLKLADERVLGEADLPVFESAAKAMHEVDATPAQVNRMTQWFLDYQTDQQAERDIADIEFHDVSLKSMREEWGSGAFEKNTGAIGALFTQSPPEVQDLILNGRAEDGTKLGDNPAILRWLAGMAITLYPQSTLGPAGETTGVNIETEIKAIEEKMRTDRRGYFKDEKMQARYRELVDARDRMKARNRAA